jgi:hypothetical protein
MVEVITTKEEICMTQDTPEQPTRPSHIPDYAVDCLTALADNGLGYTISLGGAFGLLHYLDYRPTHDVDAWWEPTASSADRRRVVETIEAALHDSGDVYVRSWGDVTSVELASGGHTVFSFQIAQRSAQLEPSAPAQWTDVLLDSLADLIASKMVALVERGAPRDFRDIYAVCKADIVTAEQCWALWRQRQRLTGDNTDSARARLALETHLSRIARHRPLQGITDAVQRSQAENVRVWFRTEFIHVLLD